MRRRKPTQTVPINVRLDTELVRRLERRAKESRATLSEKIRELLEDGLEDELSLTDFRADWLRRLRDTLEHAALERAARGDVEAAKNIETVWKCLQLLEAEFAQFCTKAEDKLFPYLQDPRVRELLRGAPTPLDEIKTQE